MEKPGEPTLLLFQPSPEDAVVTFTCTNIPTDKVELSATKIYSSGSTEASVTVGLKDDDFSFAATTFRK